MYYALFFVLAGYLVCLATSGYRAALRLRGDGSVGHGGGGIGKKMPFC